MARHRDPVPDEPPANGPSRGVAVERRARPERPRTGPHDGDALDPDAEVWAGTTDFAALRVPLPDGGEVSVEPPGSGGTHALHVAFAEGRLSMSALAAPKSAQLWPELANEIEASLREGGARVRSFTGTWGRELHATTGSATSVFVGIDGPRWMLYGIATGPTTAKDALGAELRRMLRGTVVVRGSSPYPVRTVLPLTLPAHLAPVTDDPEPVEAAGPSRVHDAPPRVPTNGHPPAGFPPRPVSTGERAHPPAQPPLPATERQRAAAFGRDPLPNPGRSPAGWPARADWGPAATAQPSSAAGAVSDGRDPAARPHPPVAGGPHGFDPGGPRVPPTAHLPMRGEPPVPPDGTGAHRSPPPPPGHPGAPAWSSAPVNVRPPADPHPLAPAGSRGGSPPHGSPFGGGGPADPDQVVTDRLPAVPDARTGPLRITPPSPTQPASPSVPGAGSLPELPGWFERTPAQPRPENPAGGSGTQPSPPSVAGATGGGSFGESRSADRPGSARSGGFPGVPGSADRPGSARSGEFPGVARSVDLPGSARSAEPPGSAELPGVARSADRPGSARSGEFSALARPVELPGSAPSEELAGSARAGEPRGPVRSGAPRGPARHGEPRGSESGPVDGCLPPTDSAVEQRRAESPDPASFRAEHREPGWPYSVTESAASPSPTADPPPVRPTADPPPVRPERSVSDDRAARGRRAGQPGTGSEPVLPIAPDDGEDREPATERAAKVGRPDPPARPNRPDWRSSGGADVSDPSAAVDGDRTSGGGAPGRSGGRRRPADPADHLAWPYDSPGGRRRTADLEQDAHAVDREPRWPYAADESSAAEPPTTRRRHAAPSGSTTPRHAAPGSASADASGSAAGWPAARDPLEVPATAPGSAAARPTAEAAGPPTAGAAARPTAEAAGPPTAEAAARGSMAEPEPAVSPDAPGDRRAPSVQPGRLATATDHGDRDGNGNRSGGNRSDGNRSGGNERASEPDESMRAIGHRRIPRLPGPRPAPERDENWGTPRVGSRRAERRAAGDPTGGGRGRENPQDPAPRGGPAGGGRHAAPEAGDAPRAERPTAAEEPPPGPPPRASGKHRRPL